jgi:putative ABC transport system permease protein
MNTRDILEETYTALLANKVRTGLTMLGIIIGIASVIAMTALGAGAKNSIQTSIEGLGSNLLTILPGVVQPGRGIVSSGRGSAQTLKNEDIDVIRAIDGATIVSPESQRRFHNLSVATGSFITDANERNIGRVAVLGATVAKDLFGEEDPIGQTVRINQVNFVVTGILTAKGGAGFSGPDDMILVPLSTMQKILSGADYLSTIAVSVADKNQMNDVKDAINNALISKHRVDEADFSVISQADILGTLTTVIDTFTLFLAAVAGISLLVGGIGIMNMMLTTVTERTREIGLRKAIGATKKDINRQFLIEAIMLTFIGGVIGVTLGSLLSYAVTSLGIVQTEVSISSVILAFGVSATIGIVFGYYPAKRAGNLSPIEALRYE